MDVAKHPGTVKTITSSRGAEQQHSPVEQIEPAFFVLQPSSMWAAQIK